MAQVIKYDVDQSQLAISGEDLRQGLANICKEAAPKARLHARWMLRFKLSESAAILKADKEANGKAHCVMISIFGETPREETQHQLIIPCEVGIYLFVEHLAGLWAADDPRTSEQILDEERREIERLIFCNRSFLAMDNPAGLHAVELPSFENDVISFGDLHCNTAQGRMNLRLREQFIYV